MEIGATVLRDIHGLDTIPWWPLATGWWYVVGLVGLLLLSIPARYWLIYHSGWFGWRGDALGQLRALKKALASEAPQTVASRLSELLRRIAMVRSGRKGVASLTGDNWLQWLAAHDKTGFDWERQGQILLTAPYMPPTMSVERKELAKLIRAATRWIDASRPARQKTPWLQRCKSLWSGSKDGVNRV